MLWAFSEGNTLVALYDQQITSVPKFKYFASIMQENVKTDKEIKRKWREVSDKKMPIHLMGKIYKIMIRPVYLYRAVLGNE